MIMAFMIGLHPAGRIFPWSAWQLPRYRAR